jgi:IclR family acetate operon transcriptional repressor
VDLAAATGDAVHLVALEDRHVVLLERVAGTGPVQVVLPIGHRVPAHAGASGKAILAALGPDATARVLDGRRERLTDSTIVERDALAAELANVRERGYAVNVGEWDHGVAAVAAAIVVDGRPVGAISVSSTPQRLPRSRMDEIAPLVVAAAACTAAAVV